MAPQLGPYDKLSSKKALLNFIEDSGVRFLRLQYFQRLLKRDLAPESMLPCHQEIIQEEIIQEEPKAFFSFEEVKLHINLGLLPLVVSCPHVGPCGTICVDQVR